MPLQPPERKGPAWASAGSGYSQGLTILIELAAIIGLFSYAGYRLDRLFGTKPVLLAVLMVLGYVGGVFHVWIWVRRRAESDDQQGR